MPHADINVLAISLCIFFAHQIHFLFVRDSWFLIVHWAGSKRYMQIAGLLIWFCSCFVGMANFAKNFHSSGKPDSEKKYQGTLIASPAKAISPKTIKNIVPKQLILSRESTVQVASFLAKVIALEVVRRISKARCPFIWNSIQALQILGYPPFRWIQRWAPLKFVVQGIQVIFS